MCGDGSVDPDEACDDGNDINDDGCKSDCTLNVCGDSIKGPSEGCDDGNMAPGDGCDETCSLETCGDGISDNGEECDDGNVVDDDECANNCTTAKCGNGLKQATEECDDGAGNSASAICTDECKVAVCGDTKTLEVVEECDDGNTDDKDGCTQACKLPECGDGFQQGAEECDDGNPDETDTCTTMCTTAKCGDGFVQDNEQCDDKNADDNDVCKNDCKLNAQIVFVTSGSFLGDLGGMGGADAKCMAAAAAGQLPGTYKAWLSTDGQDATNRLSHSGKPYYLPNGIKVAENWDDLVSPPLLAAINITETGDQAGGTTTVWTATEVNGTNWPSSDCTVWSAQGNNGFYGLRDATNEMWTKSGSSQPCKNKMAHLYCFQQ